MKRIITIILLLVGTNCFCQINLVPNWSFEDTVGCPKVTLVTFFSYTPPWFCPTMGTPDIYNACDDTSFTPNVGVPYNSGGFQYAKTGVGYAGLFCYQGGGEAREYLSIKLTDTLKASKKYCIGFYTSLANISHWGINQMGVYVSKDSFYLSTYYNIPYIPQINYNSGFLTDTTNWMEVSGEYVATGGEKFITIGNFKDDSNTDTILIDINNPEYPYYYIDDVFVYDCTDTIMPEDTNSLSLVNAFTPNGDGKNDVWHVRVKNIQKLKAKIINRWGQELYYWEDLNAGWDGTYNGNDVSAGVYYYIVEVTFSDGEIRNKAGSIQLIR
ncbi:MAG: gliding motility-associated C-terminal domain-containing protein [Bacteroidota bacterium]